MGKILFISEKPKVTKALLSSPRFKNSKKIPGKEAYNGYYENDKYINTWALGHLLEVYNPEDHDKTRKEFSFEVLPNIFPLKYKPKKEVQEQLEIITKLINRTDVEMIVNACDIDKEGELIFRELIEYTQTEKPIFRILLSSYELTDIEAALNRIEKGEDFELLAAAGKSRQYLDHLIGDTITRASTIKLAQKQFLLSGGRIQLCLLSEIRKRELAVEKFTPQTFYNLVVDTGFKSTLYSEEQILNPKPLQELMERLKGKELTVKSYVEKQTKRNASHLYNLTDLYKDCIKKLKIPSPKAKKVIQSLYEEGFITYPRTDSRHLPTTMVESVKEAVKTLQVSTDYSQVANIIEIEQITQKHRSFNDDLVTAHFAIIPTKKALPGERTDLEKKIYNLIAKRFLANWMKPAVYSVKETSLIDPENNIYKASEKVLIDKGFLTVFTEEIEDDTIMNFSIPELSEGEQLKINSTFLKEGKTRRPSYHTEDSILTFMETAGRNLIEDEELKELMKGKRIGTPATEETFIPKLLQRGYITFDKGKIKTSSLGASFIDSFPVEEIKDPSFTAEMEYKIQCIQQGEVEYEKVIKETNEFAYKIVEEMKKVSESTVKHIVTSRQEDIEIAKCKCGGTIIDKTKFFGCTNFPECKVSIPKVIKEKTIPGTQIQKLLSEGETDLIKGFKGEQGTTFDAFIIYKDEQLQFRFQTIEEMSYGNCPKCNKGKVLKKKSGFYGCSEYKGGCDFSFPGEIKGKKIPEGQVKKYLKHKTTDFINGFQGEKGEFTAALVMKDDFTCSFQFPTKEDRTIGKCPICKGNVLIGKSFYLCENYKKTCQFILNPVFFEKTIPVQQIKKLLDKNITDTIKGFKSTKNQGKEFSARVSYDTNQKRLILIFK